MTELPLQGHEMRPKTIRFKGKQRGKNSRYFQLQTFFDGKCLHALDNCIVAVQNILTFRREIFYNSDSSRVFDNLPVQTSFE